MTQKCTHQTIIFFVVAVNKTEIETRERERERTKLYKIKIAKRTEREIQKSFFLFSSSLHFIFSFFYLNNF